MCLVHSPLERRTGLGMGSHLPAAGCNRAEHSQALPSSFSFAGFKTQGFLPSAGGAKPCADLHFAPINHSWGPGYETSPKTQRFGALFTQSRCQSTLWLGSGDALPSLGPPLSCIPHQGDVMHLQPLKDLSAEQRREATGCQNTRLLDTDFFREEKASPCLRGVLSVSKHPPRHTR